MVLQFTDLAMRDVHIEAVFGYNTSNFLMALSSFASIRRWSEKIYSDPGSQLVGAERELKEAWKGLIGSHYREAPRRMVQLGYLVLPIVIGIKDQLNH